ncbi:MAG TPA: ABC transporter ATP-binding protein [Acidimicrobiia bacterium]|jgi:teichoic acid transport system ATP-binding protein
MAGTDLPGTGERPITLSVRDASVVYRPSADTKRSLRDSLLGRAQRSREIHAVEGVSFDLAAGDILGIIGSNGSGKSTLLRAIAGLIPLESGSIYARSIPTLLGVGAVLQPKLSGRRNIIIGGLALGLDKMTLRDRFDDIVRFAGLGEFIDLPMQTYSSGMRARLLFSVSTIVRPELLLVDEALAVGDASFKRRSLKRLRSMAQDAGTVVLVSHKLGEIRGSCNRVIWLEKGEKRMDGEPAAVIEAYKDHWKAQDEAEAEAEQG